jgi:hypothetical protein
MAVLKLKDFKAAVDEMNALFFDPPQDVDDLDEDDLKDWIKSRAQLREEGDEFSVKTEAIIKEVVGIDEEKETKKPVDKKAKKVEVEELPEDDPEDENKELKENVEAAETMKELKQIISDNEVFESLDNAKVLKGYKDVDDLRDVMLELLEPDAAPEEKIEEPEPVKKKKAVEPEPVKKVVDEPEKKVKAKVEEVEEKPKKKITVVKEEKETKVKKEKAVSERKVTLFGTAIEVLCTDPFMTVETLKKKVKSKGLDPEVGNGVRSAHVIVKKIAGLLKKNGLLG